MNYSQIRTNLLSGESIVVPFKDDILLWNEFKNDSNSILTHLYTKNMVIRVVAKLFLSSNGYYVQRSDYNDLLVNTIISDDYLRYSSRKVDWKVKGVDESGLCVLWYHKIGPNLIDHVRHFSTGPDLSQALAVICIKEPKLIPNHFYRLRFYPYWSKRQIKDVLNYLFTKFNFRIKNSVIEFEYKVEYETPTLYINQCIDHLDLEVECRLYYAQTNRCLDTIVCPTRMARYRFMKRHKDLKPFTLLYSDYKTISDGYKVREYD